MASSLQPILDDLGRLRAQWPKRGWSFDNRFECVASSFGTDFAREARRLLAPLFPHTIDERTLSAASPALQEVANRTGGVRSTQVILGGNPVGGVTPYGLWWPWEESQTISLRIGLDGASMAELEELCTCFGAVR